MLMGFGGVHVRVQRCQAFGQPGYSGRQILQGTNLLLFSFQ
jgi:hypothetical protein